MNFNITGLIRSALPLLVVLLTACGGGGGGGSSSPTSYTIGGTVSGLTGTVVLQDNGGNNATVSASGGFTFSTQIASGSAYSVTVLTQPATQVCSVTNGSGTVAAANISTVTVACVNAYPIGGNVAGLLAGRSVVLQDNNPSNNATVSANGVFTFSTQIASGSSYAVTVLTQPPGQNCSVTFGSGTANAIVNNVAVACSDNNYNVGATVTGLVAAASVVLQDNLGGNLTISSNSTPTNFAGTTPSGSPYAVTVLTQPVGENCVVASGSGTVVSTNVNVAVSCTPNTYTIGGSVSGLAGNPVTLQDNNVPTDLVSANGVFAFSTLVANGSSYAVTVLIQPTGQNCAVTNGSGTVAAANINTVAVSCGTNYNIGANVNGLVANTSVVLQDNGGDNLTISSNGVPTNFNTALANGSAYAVTVQTQPVGGNCVVSGIVPASGTVAGANVTVTVNCTPINYTIGGSVSGLTGTVVLQDNGGDNKSMLANGPFTFATPLASGSSYAVTVSAQPVGQNCAVANGSGPVVAANVSNVAVSCGTNYNIGATVTGLAAGPIVLQDNGGDNLTISSNGTLTNFNTALATGSPYAVTVLSPPAGETCVVTSGSGTVTSANVNVAIACDGKYVSEGGLTWMPVSATEYTYAQTLALCAGTINGTSGWRLPTDTELLALLASGAMNGQGWDLTTTGTWSSTGFGGAPPPDHYMVFLNAGNNAAVPNGTTALATCVK